MPDEATGPPSFDGEGPDDDRDHGAEDAFDAVVLDEEFIRAAVVHEPTAAERQRAAAQARAEAEAASRLESLGHRGTEGEPDEFDDGSHEPFSHLDGDGYGERDPYDPPWDDAPHAHPNPHYAEWARSRPARHRAPVRWYRPVAWLLAVLMGVGAVAMALAAVQRGGPGQRDEPRSPPSSSEPGRLGAPGPGLPASARAPASTLAGAV